MSRKPLKNSFHPEPSTQQARDFVNSAFWGGKDTVTKLLKKYGAAIVNKSNEDGSTALIYAAGSGHKDLVVLLLKKGASLDKAAGTSGMTALIAAAANGHKGIVSILLKKGASIDKKDRDGSTALMCARAGNEIKVAEFLEQWPEMERQRREQQLAVELDAITNTIMGGLTKSISYKKPLQFKPPGKL